MRSKFDMQLKELHDELLEMGAMVETSISNATKALIDNDMEAAEKAIQADKNVNSMERNIEKLCLKLLLQQQPVAKDLRQISSALKMITDLERIGDQARDIARIVSEIDFSDCKRRVSITGMADATKKMLAHSLNAYVSNNLEMAHDVIKEDDIVDEYFTNIKKELIDLIQVNESKAESAVYLLMIAKYFERIGDHAVNIAEWVIFSITGKHENEGE